MWAQVAVTGVLLFAVNSILQVEFPVYEKGLIVISGASSGIGRDAAIHLAAAGFTVLAGVRKPKDFAELSGYNLPSLQPVVMDVTKDKDVREVAARVEKSGLPLVALVNNAGISFRMPLEALDMAMVHSVYNVNVFGLMSLTKACLPAIRRSKGRIVNVGSVSGQVATPSGATYSGTKFAVEGITDALRREMLPLGVSVSLVTPGYIKTAIGDKNNDADVLARQMTPEQRQVYAPWLRTIVQKRKRAFALAANVSVTTDAIVDAITNSRPQTRYVVGNAGRLPAWVASWLCWLLPDRMMDLALSQEETITMSNVDRPHEA